MKTRIIFRFATSSVIKTTKQIFYSIVSELDLTGLASLAGALCR
jgi:hypothetical protein